MYNKSDAKGVKKRLQKLLSPLNSSNVRLSMGGV